MPLSKLQFKPGVNREVTAYTNEGGWFDIDYVRFQKGFPEKIGGWQKRGSDNYLGTARALHPWVTLDRDQFMGVGTNLKYYIDRGGEYNDITPLRVTTAAGDVTFAATNGSSTLVITDSGHGSVAGDFVTFTGAASLGGTITAAVLNQEYQISLVANANSYQITARTAGSLINDPIVPVLANGSDTGNGGSSVVGAYQINTGLDIVVRASGWGAGTWSRGTWGSASTSPIVSNTLRLWSNDNFGEDLLINVRDGGIYYWDATGGLGTRAVDITTLSSLPSIPTVAKQVLVSDRDRHVIAFGADDLGASSTATDGSGTQDPLLIRFSSQENPVQWYPTASNTAGDLRISSGSTIVQAVETRQQILVFTDVSIHAMQFIGPPFTFGINLISENITIASPKAAVAVDDQVFWMGDAEFYAYSGAVQRIPCTVRDFVFDGMNRDQKEKVVAGANVSFSEVWWFYPSNDAGNTENDRYVVYNYMEKLWFIGTLGRTAWLDRGISAFPIATSTDNFLFNHEKGTEDDGSAMSTFIESGDMRISQGNQFSFISRVIPDVNFRETTDTSTMNFILETKNFPGQVDQNSSTNAVAKTSATPIDQYTNQYFTRLRGRSFTLKVQSTTENVLWRLGVPRIEIRPDGRR